MASTTLPQDIIFQHILVRLPAKPIVRFFCVSRSWFSSLTHPTFIRLHHNHNRRRNYHMLFFPLGPSPEHPPSTLLRENTLELFDVESPQPFYDRTRRVIGSANGLVCFTIQKPGFYAWNPFIRAGFFIPPTPPFAAKPSHIPHPFGYTYISRHFFCMGFGFNPWSSDFNVIVIPLRAFPEKHLVHLISRFPLQKIIYMYSHNNKSWKEVQSRVEDFIYDGDCGISLGGSMYWLGRNNGLEQRKKIVSFNIGNECFQDIALPKYELDAPDDDFSFPTTFSIQVVEESLHLSIIPQGRSHCHIWMLEEGCGSSVRSWTKKNKVALPDAFWFFSKKLSWVSGLTLDGLLWVASYDKKDWFDPKETDCYLLYNPKSDKFKNCRRSPIWFGCICLTESLIGLPHREMRSEVGYEHGYSFRGPKQMLSM